MTGESDGILDWLVYIVVALVTLLFTLWNNWIGGRLTKVEDKTEINNSLIHRQDGGLRKHVDQKFDALDKKMESRRLETKQDVKDLHKKIDAGHAEILKEIKNGKS